ncbi:MAG: hypothetical protein OXI01_06805 [Albidovulum sp.]|nr:hypothetical protein [Albidovulum sp.]
MAYRDIEKRRQRDLERFHRRNNTRPAGRRETRTAPARAAGPDPAAAGREADYLHHRAPAVGEDEPAARDYVPAELVAHQSGRGGPGSTLNRDVAD